MRVNVEQASFYIRINRYIIKNAPQKIRFRRAHFSTVDQGYGSGSKWRYRHRTDSKSTGCKTELKVSTKQAVESDAGSAGSAASRQSE